MQIADMHTHKRGVNRFSLVSSLNSDVAEFVSLEMHPWHLPEKFLAPGTDFIEKASRCAAVGEVGLDKLRGPDIAVQRRYLDWVLETAASLRKPVVIHCVRSEAELLSALKGFPCNVLVHGFNGGARQLAKYIEAGFFISFSKISNPSMADFLASEGLRNTGLESDDTKLDIEAVFENLKSYPFMENSAENSLETFRRFLKYDGA